MHRNHHLYLRLPARTECINLRAIKGILTTGTKLATLIYTYFPLVPPGWWFVSNGREEGWAPCSYLEGDKEEEAVTNLGKGY